jgi:prepilin-type N-terminal cleavage/methylation domain-containing protein
MSRDRVSGFTLIELLIVLAVLGVLVSISAPILLRARQSGDLAVAVASLRTIHSAQNAFASACGAGMYASRLPQLLLAPPGGAPFIPPDLGASDTVHKAGYTITMAEGSDAVVGTTPPCNGVASTDVFSSFFASASPPEGMAGPLFLWMGTEGTVFGYAQPLTWTRGDEPPPAASPLGLEGRRWRPGKLDDPGAPAPGPPTPP